MKTHGKNSIELLNTGVDEFYTYKANFINVNKVVEFKAMFITFINQLERLFNGVFGKTFMIEDSVDVELFQNLFPFMFECATKEDGENGLQKLCSILSTFRRLNAHAYAKCDFGKDLDAKYILKSIPNYNPEIKYWTNNDIPTLAGMISILFFLSNDKCAKIFIKNDIWDGFIEELNYFGTDYKPNLFSFPTDLMNVNKINDEIDIRKIAGKTLIDAIFGRFAGKITFENNYLHYQNGNEFEDSSFHVDFIINDQKIIIKKNSNYHSFFKNDYELLIDDVDDFVQWCNKVPPFMFVVFLYRAGVKNYKKNSLNDIQKTLVLKLNKPKFYVDKNVDILLLSNSVSDIRLGSQVVSSGINYCLYTFELMIYKRKGLAYTKYSNLRDALKYNNLSNSIIDKIVTIRNFFSHYHILGDDHVVGKESRKIDLAFIIQSFGEFILELKADDEYKATNVANDFFYRVVSNLLLFKYADIAKKCDNFLISPSIDKYESINKTFDRINSSFITEEDEEKIKKVFPERTIILYKVPLNYIHKCVIRSKKPITFKNGETFNETISLLTLFEIDPNMYISNNSCRLENSSKSGFISTKEWFVS